MQLRQKYVDYLIFLTVFLIAIASSLENTEENEENSRRAKLLPIFQVIRFQNEPCTTSTKNGTCFTASECEERGGSSSGSCAAGFGVCCVISLACGGMTSDNCTYITQSATNTITPSPCQYKICKCKGDICRIRLDFNTFNIAGPVVGTSFFKTQTAGGTNAPTNNGGAIGDCLTDSFTLSAPGSNGPPRICGFNTGQHMIVDASDECHVASFNIRSTSFMKQWDIKVTQFKCNDDIGGPPGCLQYFTEDTGQIASFNFPTNMNTVPFDTTHLSSQMYNMCIRQNVGKCGICYNPVVIGSGKKNNAVKNREQGSFGVSLSSGNKALGGTDAMCQFDYLRISGATRSSANRLYTVVIEDGLKTYERICGRFFNIDGTEEQRITNIGDSICSSTTPFQVTFITDADEMTTKGDTMLAQKNEQSRVPGGIVGFHLNYIQQNC